MTMLVTVCIVYFMKVHVILDAFFCPFLLPCVGEGYDPGWMILGSGTVWCVEKWGFSIWVWKMVPRIAYLLPHVPLSAIKFSAFLCHCGRVSASI